MRLRILFVPLVFTTAVTGLSLPTPQTVAPRVSFSNGTLEGVHLPAFKEDVFLGVPFAEPPVNNLRLRHPIPYQKAWSGIRNATVRTPSCPGYAGFDVGLTFAEGMVTIAQFNSLLS